MGNRTLIGTGSTILQRVNIGTDVTVASGSVVFAGLLIILLWLILLDA